MSVTTELISIIVRGEIVRSWELKRIFNEGSIPLA